jgi:serine protease AprX
MSALALERRRVRPRSAAAAIALAVAASGVAGATHVATPFANSGSGTPSASAGAGWDPTRDLGSLASVADATGARDAWTTWGTTGKGVDVALIDSGVVPVDGLAGPGKIVNGPDLSADASVAGMRHLDAYGHGTHMAGIIAGRDSAVGSGQLGESNQFVGIAPDARLVNVKVASADGSTDVARVIAAIDWVVQHRNDAGMNIRVLSLSFSATAAQSYLLDPLSRAVENAWHHGIVTVVASGNEGAGAATLTNPAINPYVIAVGASDNQGTSSVVDDTVAAFTNGGDATRRVDLVAPGRSIVSLRDPGSYVDEHHPEGRVTGDRSFRFFRGTGTSQATAVVSGGAALLLQQRPDLTPDQVKDLLVSTARPLAAGTTGLLDIVGALGRSTPDAVQTHARATGTGPIASSETSVATDVAHVFGQIWSGNRWSGNRWSGNRWSGNRWSGNRWSGNRWSGNRWSGNRWSGNRWSGNRWSGNRWS